MLRIWSPFREMESLRSEIDRVFNDLARTTPLPCEIEPGRAAMAHHRNGTLDVRGSPRTRSPRRGRSG